MSPAELPGRVTFYEFFQPPLESGPYELAISQRVRSDDPANPFDETFRGALSIDVQGVRFSLPPGYVHTQFPPPGAQGEYSNVLPHVVLAVETLPWQRSPLAPVAGDGSPPWLALLTFDRDDPVPAVRPGRFGDLMADALPPGTVSYPQLEPQVGETVDDPVRFIDVPADLFGAIAPTLDELRWLAHGRHVDEEAISRRALSPGGEPAPQDLSVVISNRLPAPGHESVCCLVSIERMAGLLPPQPVEADVVRLAVLATWSFGSVTRDVTFRAAFEDLGHEPGTLEVPYAAGRGPTSQAVQDALRMGYSAFDHATRQGASTVSWYRGPLLPFDVPQEGEVPFPSADSLTRYDPDSGMLDVSLAAAWQIGRLLALGDRAFSTLLYDWKQGRLAQAVIDFEREVLREQLGAAADGAFEPGVPAQVSLMRNVVRPLLTALLEEAASR